MSGHSYSTVDTAQSAEDPSSERLKVMRQKQQIKQAILIKAKPHSKPPGERIIYGTSYSVQSCSK